MIKTSTDGKHLGVYLDQNLKLQDALKNILLKMANGTKTLYVNVISFQLRHYYNNSMP